MQEGPEIMDPFLTDYDYDYGYDTALPYIHLEHNPDKTTHFSFNDIFPSLLDPEYTRYWSPVPDAGFQSTASMVQDTMLDTAADYSHAVTTTEISSLVHVAQ